jgi:hypothetical protein
MEQEAELQNEFHVIESDLNLRGVAQNLPRTAQNQRNAGG